MWNRNSRILVRPILITAIFTAVILHWFPCPLGSLHSRAAAQERAPAAGNPVDWILDVLVDHPDQYVGVILAMVGILYCYVCICLTVIAVKTNTPYPILAWIPLVNVFYQCRIGRVSYGWVLAMIIPILNLIAVAVIWGGMAKALGKSAWMGVLMLVPVINLLLPLILALSSSRGVPPAMGYAPAGGYAPPSGGPRRCPNCGTPAAPGDAFCGECGGPVPAAAVYPASAPGQQSSGGAAATGAIALLLALAGIAFGVYQKYGAEILSRFSQKRDAAPVEFEQKQQAPGGFEKGFVEQPKAPFATNYPPSKSTFEEPTRSPPAKREEPPPLTMSAPAAYDRRQAFIYNVNGQQGGFVNRADVGQWIEYCPDGTNYYFQEVARNRDMVEIYDGSRQITVRLYADYSTLRRFGYNGDQFGRLYAGYWGESGQVLPSAGPTN